MSLKQTGWAVGVAAMAGAFALVNPAVADTTTVNGALKFKSDDGQFTAQVGGRIMQDWAFIKADNDAKAVFGAQSIDGTELRRARLFVSGTMYGNVGYKAQYDFAGGVVVPKDVYIELKKTPVGAIRVGNFFEPFSLEEVTSSKYITFMERSLVTTFAPSRNMGLMVHGSMADGRGTYAAGIFRDDSGFDAIESVENAAYSETARLTFTPQNEDGGRRLIHVGAGATLRRPNSKAVRYRVRPETHLSGRLLDTTAIPADRVLGLDFEGAMVAGPLSVQGEFAMVSLTAPDSDGSGRGGAAESPEPTFNAFAASVSYWVTGEHRAYKNGSFSRTKPLKNYGDGDGWGALQLAARFSSINLDHDDVPVGTMNDITLGANWHLNPQARVMVNYVLASPETSDGDSGTVNVLQTRFQIDF